MKASVLKIGGALAVDSAAMAEVWSGVDALRRRGEVVIVHGGGPRATSVARRLGHEPRIVAGRRVTADLDLEVALWTLRGEVNARLAAGALAHGVPAVGLSGVDGGLITVSRRPPREVDGETVDFGHVGDVVACEPRVLRVLLDAGFVPVIAPLCADAAGAVYNVNADTVALAIAEALGADTLTLVGEAGGVYSESRATGPLDQIDGPTFHDGVRAGWIAGGMRPKLEVGFQALARGIRDVRICAPAGVANGAGTRLV